MLTVSKDSSKYIGSYRHRPGVNHGLCSHAPAIIRFVIYTDCGTYSTFSIVIWFYLCLVLCRQQKLVVKFQPNLKSHQ